MISLRDESVPSPKHLRLLLSSLMVSQIIRLDIQNLDINNWSTFPFTLHSFFNLQSYFLLINLGQKIAMKSMKSAYLWWLLRSWHVCCPYLFDKVNDATTRLRFIHSVFEVFNKTTVNCINFGLPSNCIDSGLRMGNLSQP